MQFDDNQPDHLVDTDAMWRSPSDSDIQDMQALEGVPYVPSTEGNPYAQADQTRLLNKQPGHDASEQAAGQTTYLGNQQTQVVSSQGAGQMPNQAAGQAAPQTQYNAAANPVPSPPQQNPYLPGQNEKGSTMVQPALKRPRAQRFYAQDSAASAHTAGSNAPQQDAQPRRSFLQRLFSPRQHKRPKHGFLSFFLWLIILATYAFLSLRLLPTSYATGRLVPELASFIPLALIPAAICFVLALLWHRRALVVVSFFALAINAYWHAGYFIPTQRVSTAAENAVLSGVADTSDSYARIMTLNTLNGYASAVDVVRICREQNVEVLCLQEMTSGMVQDLINAGIDEVLPYRVVSEEATAISNGGRNAIYTKAPMSNITGNLLPIDTSSMPAVDITIGNQTVRFVSVHPNSPVRGAQDLWDEGLSIIGSLSNYYHSYVVMGDFNSTWDHVRFRELLGSTFVDASQQSGEGFHMTYPSDGASLTIKGHTIEFPCPSLIEIDHIVYSKNSGIVISSLETVSVSGTDHKALLATLEVTS